jgi:hypothetical protein
MIGRSNAGVGAPSIVVEHVDRVRGDALGPLPDQSKLAQQPEVRTVANRLSPNLW